MDLSGKVVVVTGASRGLGLALAQQALASGAQVGACARSELPLGAAPQLVTRRLSVDDPRELGAFADLVVERFGQVDLWVNNAGILGPVGPLRTAEPEGLQQALAVNVLGVMYGGQVFASLCRQQGRSGVMLNISSGAARRAYSGWAAYCASKAAVDRLSEVLALEEPLLRVHSMAPGVFESDMQASLRELAEDVFPEVSKFQGLHRDGALLAPTEVAAKLLSFCFEPGEMAAKVCLDARELP